MGFRVRAAWSSVTSRKEVSTYRAARDEAAHLSRRNGGTYLVEFNAGNEIEPGWSVLDVYTDGVFVPNAED